MGQVMVMVRVRVRIKDAVGGTYHPARAMPLRRGAASLPA